MEHYICIHGHFYQPPRENAWLERVEFQNSAYPYHDWNERVTAECYLPNASSRILDGEGYIEQIVNNYAGISFNFGPTLLDWLEKNSRLTYQAVLAADQQSMKRFGGHGSALAQAYNHIIMPLANQRDRASQVIWGIKDFERRFKRQPEGMWLPETAVDLATLDIMAAQGIRFTILAPHQAARARRKGVNKWHDVSGAAIDPTRAYDVSLPSGRQISVFFYDGPISHAVAFEDVLKNGDALVKRLMGAFDDRRGHPQLVHIATDGETYGHHHRFADMALAYAIREIEQGNEAKLTNYGEFLEKFPPDHEAEIIEKTSWSCVHGVDRWWSPCGEAAGSGNHPEWNQDWRTPLRNAMDYLRDTLAPRYETAAAALLRDPWAARDDYIDVVPDNTEESRERFFRTHAGHPLTPAEQATALKLLEMQRHAMLMYTSCGWFFDEISRPEPVQVIQYAGRVIQLAEELWGGDTEARFLEIMAKAGSNIPAEGDGRRIYETLVRPMMKTTPPPLGPDMGRRTIEKILEVAAAGLRYTYLPLFEKLYPPERLAAELGGPAPPAFLAAAELVVNLELHRAAHTVPIDAMKIRELLDTAARWKLNVDGEGAGHALAGTLEKLAAALAQAPEEIERLYHLAEGVKLARGLPFPVDLWPVQNAAWAMKDKDYPAFRERAVVGDTNAQAWVKAFAGWCADLRIRTE